MTRVSKTLVAGWFGNGNIGDEAILSGMTRAIREASPGFALTAFSANPAETMTVIGIGAKRRSLPFPGTQLPVELATLVRHDPYVVGGGGLLKDIGPRSGNCHRWLRPMRAAQLLGKRTMLYASGVEAVRYSESRRIIRRALDACDLVTVRDRASRRLLQEIGVKANIVVTADPAILLGSESPEPVNAEPVIMVNVRNWLTSGYEIDNPALIEPLHRELAVALDRLVTESGARVRFVPFRSRGADDDRLTCESVVSHMRHPERTTVTSISTPEEVIAICAQSDFIVGTRLHASILAAANGTPFIAIRYAPKVEHFAEHAGLPDTLVRADDAAVPGTVSTRIVDAFRGRANLRARLGVVTPVLRQLAQLNARMLVALAGEDESSLAMHVREADVLATRLEALHA